MRRSNGAPQNVSRASCDVVKVAFGLAALLSVLLNFAVVVLSPLFQLACDLEEPGRAPRPPRRLAERLGPGRGRVSEAWSSLEPVDFDSLRLLPNSELEAAARKAPRWLFFGLSSVHRKQAEYLGITLSHLFDALGESTDTGLVVHLADFDENWVFQSRDWLRNAFEDEVQANRLHVIHAPERLYPAKEQIMKNTKYGDPPLRQWWRAKQNLDYAFLMWYASGLAKYYMQLEDDVQVTPSFLPTVRRFMNEKVTTGDAWVMAAFSKLGFIGKLFDAARLPKLAEFLLIYHAEAPCDWLVWIFIDAASSQPVTAMIPQDLEDEFNQRESAKKNPNVKLPKAMRTDVLLYYKDKKPVFLSPPVPVSQKVTVAPTPLENTPAPPPPTSGRIPSARVFSTMQHYQQYAPAMALGTINKRGFWSSDTCYPTRQMEPCSAASKYVELIFDNPIKLVMLKMTMGAADHPQDYIRNGTLEVGFQLSKDQPVCESYNTLSAVRTREVIWGGTLFRAVKCLRVRLLETQQEWVMLRFEEIHTEANRVPLEASATTLSVTQALLPAPEATTATTSPAAASATSAATEVTTRQGFRMPRLSRHGLGLLHLEALRNEDHQDVFSTMLASLAGLLAGLAGWVNVFLCRRISLDGSSLVGQFPCWTSSFLPVIDSLLWTSLSAPALPVPCVAETKERKLSFRPLRSMEAMRWWSDLPQLEMEHLPRRLQHETRWEDLFTPARHLASRMQEMVVLGRLPEPKKWLTVAMRTRSQTEPHELAKVIQKLFLADDGMLVLIHLSDSTTRLTDELRKTFSSELEAGKLLAVRAPEKFYVDGRPQYELAVLFAAAASLSEFYIQVEENIVAQEGFVKMLRGYVAEQTVPNVTAPWNLVSIGRDGLHRKLMRSHQLIRFAELLPIFPEVPPDSLIWDYVDVINNQSAPKACYIAFSATKIKRSDVLLQYHKAEAIIEHVGDVSSLEGKVQRIHDDYFKKHNLLSTLFDNPAADIYPGGNLDQSTSTQLQALYGVHGNSPSMGGAPAVSLGSTIFMDLVGKAVLEVVFRKPVSVQMLNLRMGGFLRPAAKNKKKPELADPDFDFVFPNAELSVGRARTGAVVAPTTGLRGKLALPAKGFCSVYEPLTNFSGREVFWRSPTSRPAANVECVKVTLLEAPKSSVIIRTIRVRSAKSVRRLESDSEAPVVVVAKPRSWQAEMKSWAQRVTVAFAAGGLAGTLGLAVTMLPWFPSPKSRRRSKVSQA